MRSDDPAQEFTVVDVGILILEAVAVLHARGHQQLRIFPGMSGSGMHWRTAVTHANNFASNGLTGLRDFDAAFLYTTGSGFEVGGERVDASTTAPEVADRILALLPDSGAGADADYVAWYRDLIDLVRRHHALPIAYADYFDDEDGWEIGWGSGVRIPAPRPPGHDWAPVAVGADSSVPRAPDADGRGIRDEEPISNGLPPKVSYAELTSKQKEIYNFQKVASLLADHGFNCIKLADDWQGADFLAYHKDGDHTLKVQLKGRLTIDQKYVGKGLHMAFPIHGVWHIIDHDALVDLCREHTNWLATASWASGGYSSQNPNANLKSALAPFALVP